ncbi:SPRTN [Blepharisma stoltei]|uniref:SprT-like domain-containing protein n=1 Tax=Blepharisma stoltei TaxID=1481888 RepID=A0AAU9KG93_9CILI|nr:unnamed protein product [Blepharisma stoltei]
MEELEFPDIYDLFQTFDVQFFEGKLGVVELIWSKRMTLCAGLCCYKDGLITIKLSEPLLKYRSISELKETLIHEMIHAYLWIMHIESGRDGHGPAFQDIMITINAIAGLNVTIYHSFHDEVDFYRKHIWKCDGPCQNWKPYYGLVKRAMNRPPSDKDPWWNEHQKKCGGKYTKIAEPTPKKKKKEEATKITKFFKNDNKDRVKSENK